MAHCVGEAVEGGVRPHCSRGCAQRVCWKQALPEGATVVSCGGGGAQTARTHCGLRWPFWCNYKRLRTLYTRLKRNGVVAAFKIEDSYKP